MQRFESGRIAVAVVLLRGDARQLFESAHLSRTLPARDHLDEAFGAVRAWAAPTPAGRSPAGSPAACDVRRRRRGRC